MARFHLNIPKPEKVASFWRKAFIEIPLFSCYGVFAAGLLLILLGNSLFQLSAEISNMVARVVHWAVFAAAVVICLEMATITLAEVYFADKAGWNFRIRVFCSVFVSILLTFWLISDITFSGNPLRLIPSVAVILFLTPVEFSMGWMLYGMLMKAINRLRTRIRGSSSGEKKADAHTHNRDRDF